MSNTTETTATLTLADFILARIEADEATARAAAASDPVPWCAEEGYVLAAEHEKGSCSHGDYMGHNMYGGLWDNEGAESLSMSPETAGYIARHDPARVLAECAAYRRIVEEHPNSPTQWDTIDGPRHGWECWRCSDSVREQPCPTLRALASIWADHPEFREEWRL